MGQPRKSPVDRWQFLISATVCFSSPGFFFLISALHCQLSWPPCMFMCYRSAVRQRTAELICLTGAEERFVRATAPCWRSDASEVFRSLVPRSDQTLSNSDS
ncbi:hypothetical protein XENOCAPTIV_013821 [Xenoophorus captivus]|uniref:Secreted protein n=1 Tax=Xenoophorus captivus TaxID=1517983 RepID=A0ABV0QD97_9TELE